MTRTPAQGRRGRPARPDRSRLSRPSALPRLTTLAVAALVLAGATAAAAQPAAEAAQAVARCHDAAGIWTTATAPWRDASSALVDPGLEACVSAVAAHPRDPRLQAQLANVLISAGRLEEAQLMLLPLIDTLYPPALFLMGRMLETVDGSDRAKARARDLHAQAADAGYAPSALALAIRLFDNPAADAPAIIEAFARARQAAELGLPDGMYVYGGLMAQGASGIKQPREGLAWIERAAEAGMPAAVLHAAQTWLDDADVGPDPHKARHWAERAVALDLVGGKTVLGRIYADGLGVERDVARGIALLEQAAAAGDVEAKGQLAWRMATGTGIAQDTARACALLEETRRAGDADAEWRLVKYCTPELDDAEFDQIWAEWEAEQAAAAATANGAPDADPAAASDPGAAQ